MAAEYRDWADHESPAMACLKETNIGFRADMQAVEDQVEQRRLKLTKLLSKVLESDDDGEEGQLKAITILFYKRPCQRENRSNRPST